MNWFLQWDMDGCQWDVLAIDMFEESMDCIGNKMFEGQYIECLKFIYEHLLYMPNSRRRYNVKHITMRCPEHNYIIPIHDFEEMLKEHMPEEFI